MGGGARSRTLHIICEGGLILVGRLLRGGLLGGRLSVGWDVVCGQGGAVSYIMASQLAGSNRAKRARYSPLLSI